MKRCLNATKKCPETNKSRLKVLKMENWKMLFKTILPFGAKGIFLSSAKNASFQGVLPGSRKFLKKSKLHCDSPFDDSLWTSARSEPLPSGPSLSGNAWGSSTRLCFPTVFFSSLVWNGRRIYVRLGCGFCLGNYVNPQYGISICHTHRNQWILFTYLWAFLDGKCG